MSEEKSLAIIAPRTFGEVQQMSEALSKSSLLPDALKGRAIDVAFQIMTGAELGLSPMASIRGVHIIQGKPMLSADTMVALCLGSGLCEYFVQVSASATAVTYETKRKGSPVPQRVTWTWEEAKRAALTGKDNWRLHPRQMLASRAKAELARLAYPDVLAGCYDPDELQVPVAVRVVETVQDAEFVETHSLMDQIVSAPSLAALDVLVPKIRVLVGDELAQHRAAYIARKCRLATGFEMDDPRAADWLRAAKVQPTQAPPVEDQPAESQTEREAEPDPT